MINQKTTPLRILPVLFLFLSVLASCSDNLDADILTDEVIEEVDDTEFEPTDWTVETEQ